MKKLALSAVLATALSSFAVADTAMEIDILKAQIQGLTDKIAELEAKQQKKDDKSAGTTIKSKAPVIELSGTHYLGFTSTDDNLKDDRTNKFETRRNYIQTKAYFKENPKDYLRITLDTFQNTKEADGAADADSWEVRLKYAYLYLDNILPHTGVELGQAHRPWIDYEEHNSWKYRSISKVFVEDKDHGVDFTNSADLGFNFKTKTPYFSSELGLFNGAGYHGLENGQGLSAEWRLTAHLLGTGKEKAKDDLQYANVSFFGQRNNEFDKKGDSNSGDFNWYGVHAVYNQPEFLLAAQYVKTQDAKAGYDGKGYSFNGEYRFMPDWSLIGMYNSYNYNSTTPADVDKMNGWLAGIAYNYNKNVKFIANYLSEEKDYNDGKKALDKDSIMLTAEINW